MLDLFIPLNEETVIELSEQTYEQHKANLSTYTSYLIEGVEMGAAIIAEEMVQILTVAQNILHPSVKRTPSPVESNK